MKVVVVKFVGAGKVVVVYIYVFVAVIGSFVPLLSVNEDVG